MPGADGTSLDIISESAFIPGQYTASLARACIFSIPWWVQWRSASVLLRSSGVMQR